MQIAVHHHFCRLNAMNIILIETFIQLLILVTFSTCMFSKEMFHWIVQTGLLSSPSTAYELKSLNVSMISRPESGCHAIFIRGVQIFSGGFFQKIQITINSSFVISWHGCENKNKIYKLNVWYESSEDHPVDLSLSLPVCLREEKFTARTTASLSVS